MRFDSLGEKGKDLIGAGLGLEIRGGPPGGFFHGCLRSTPDFFRGLQKTKEKDVQCSRCITIGH